MLTQEYAPLCSVNLVRCYWVHYLYVQFTIRVRTKINSHSLLKMGTILK